MEIKSSQCYKRERLLSHNFDDNEGTRSFYSIQSPGGKRWVIEEYALIIKPSHSTSKNQKNIRSHVQFLNCAKCIWVFKSFFNFILCLRMFCLHVSKCPKGISSPDLELQMLWVTTQSQVLWKSLKVVFTTEPSLQPLEIFFLIVWRRKLEKARIQ